MKLNIQFSKSRPRRRAVADKNPHTMHSPCERVLLFWLVALLGFHAVAIATFFVVEVAVCSKLTWWLYCIEVLYLCVVENRSLAIAFQPESRCESMVPVCLHVSV